MRIRSTRSYSLLLLARLLCGLACLWASLLAQPGPAWAHPMGNFSINHYARFEATPDRLSWRTVFDFAEIATAERQASLDLDNNGQVSAMERQKYLQAQAGELKRDLALSIDGKAVDFTLRPVELRLTPGAGGLPILRLAFSSSLPWPSPRSGQSARQQHTVAYRDSAFVGRTGWKEIVALNRAGAAISQSSMAARDTSRELTAFPADATAIAPSQTEGSFTVAYNARAGTAPATSESNSASSLGSEATSSRPSSRTSSTPRNGFTEAIARRDLSPGVMMLGVLAALAFGAVHALSPGHGKTMVAAYLVGTRGTARHAALLGLVVTVTHTFGVFALGLITLCAANYIVPERLYPILSALSGLLILGVGFWLLMNRLQDLKPGQAHHHHDHSHDHDHDHDHPHDHDHDHSHDHDHDHSHDHDHDHSHDHAAGHVHSHGGKAHSHAIPEGPVTARTLVALGISGGIVPCPEALVVLLAAVKMQRIAYGMLLIGAFSVGLAAALIAIGLAVVAARRHMSRWADSPVTGALTRYLPVASAAIITIIGITLTLQAVGSGRP